MTPAARTAGLLVRHIGDETLVYDLARHRAHCLNRTASVVFHLADGRRSVSDIAALLGDEIATEERHEAVRLALEKLAEAGLLGNGGEAAESAPPLASPGRREALRRVGLGAALLAPVVTSLLVPSPAEASGTCIPQSACTAAKFGQPCYSVSQAECSSKVCIDNNVCQ
jgi:hypothetical protein